MALERQSEKFQPHMVASFSRTQLTSIFLWSGKNVTQTGSSFTQDFLRDVETAVLDEKGKKMDEKAKNRLKYGEQAISVLLNHGHHLDQIQGLVMVWQVTQDENKVEVRWKVAQTTNRQSGLRRY